MKKSTQVPATLVIALAASLTAQGCYAGHECVDSFGRPLPDYDCSSRHGYMGAHYISVGGFSGSGGSGGSFGG